MSAAYSSDPGVTAAAAGLLSDASVTSLVSEHGAGHTSRFPHHQTHLNLTTAAAPRPGLLSADSAAAGSNVDNGVLPGQPMGTSDDPTGGNHHLSVIRESVSEVEAAGFGADMTGDEGQLQGVQAVLETIRDHTRG